MFFENEPSNYFSLSTMLTLQLSGIQNVLLFFRKLTMIILYLYQMIHHLFFLFNKDQRFSRIHSQFRNCFCDNDFLRRESIIFERIQYDLTISLENLRFSSRLSYISRALFHVFCSLEKYL